MMIALLTTLLVAPPVTDLVRIPAPDAGVVVLRRLVDGEGRTLLLDPSGAVVRDLGADLYPVGWNASGGLDLVRLVDDGHDLVAADGFTVDRDGGGLRRRPAAEAPEDEWAAAVERTAHERRGAPRGTLDRRDVADGAGPWVVAVDPGHGGPGAAKWNGVNGDGAGATGPGGLTEQWVNLRVAGFVLEWLAADARFAGSFATRSAMTQAVSLADRVAIAAANGADLFVSIHHNGLPTGATNRTETYWCRRNVLCEDEGEWSAPAALLHDRIVDEFGYVPRGALEDSSGSGRFHFYVLRYSAMPSALTEASNLNDAVEEALFGLDPDEDHARDEARAIYSALLAWFGYPSAVPDGRDGVTPPDREGPALTLGPAERHPRGGYRVAADLFRAGPFRVDVLDAAGRRVRSLPDLLGPGPRELVWDGRDAHGRRVGAALRWLVLREGGTLVGVRRLP